MPWRRRRGRGLGSSRRGQRREASRTALQRRAVAHELGRKSVRASRARRAPLAVSSRTAWLSQRTVVSFEQELICASAPQVARGALSDPRRLAESTRESRETHRTRTRPANQLPPIDSNVARQPQRCPFGRGLSALALLDCFASAHAPTHRIEQANMPPRRGGSNALITPVKLRCAGRPTTHLIVARCAPRRWPPYSN